MRQILTTFLLTLCFSAAAHVGAAAQERAKASPRQGEAAASSEAVRSLVSLLKNARATEVPKTRSTQRMSRIRAEGCVLRYNLVTEYESAAYYSMNRPQALDNGYRITEREVRVNLSDLDAARVRVNFWSPLKRKSGGSVYFRTAGDRESVSEQWVENSRLGARPVKRLSKAGGFPLGSASSLEGVAAALRRAIEACADDPR